VCARRSDCHCLADQAELDPDNKPAIKRRIRGARLRCLVPPAAGDSSIAATLRDVKAQVLVTNLRWSWGSHTIRA